MSAQPTPHRLFAFDTEFDASGQIVRPSTWQAPKRSYAPAEVDALVAQARLEARQQALNEVESLRANALSMLAQSVAQAMGGLTAVVQAHREEASEIALTAARVMSASAFDLYPQRPLDQAISQLGLEIESSPRLVVRAAGLDEEVRAQIEARCADVGYAGVIAFRDDPGALPAAFVLEWADGRAEFDPDAVAARIESAVKLALESDHANAIDPDQPQDDHFDRSAF